MGWYYEEKPSTQTVSEFFDIKCSYDLNGYKSRMLDCAVVSMHTAYIAVEHTTSDTEKPEVYALVCQLHYVPNDLYNFGYKEVDEDMGPIEDDCPERIMKLLTPPKSENAENWRKRCWQKIERRKKSPTIKSGKYLVLDKPINFANGDSIDTFFVENAKRRIFLNDKGGYQRYNLPATSELKDIGYDVVEDPSESSGSKENAGSEPEEELLLFSLK